MSGSIALALGVAEAISSNSLGVAATRCVRYRHKAASCKRCEQVCPARALSFDGDQRPQLNIAVCAGCGACASVCPTGALEALKPTDTALADSITRSIETTGEVTLVCGQVKPTPAEEIPVSCLSRADVSLLLFAASNGASRVRLRAGDCKSCVSGSLAPLVSGVARAASALCRDLGLETKIALTTSGAAEWDEPEEGTLSRKGFLRVLAKGGASLTSRAANAIVASQDASRQPCERLVRGEFRTFVPPARERLVQSLRSATDRRITRANGFLFSTPVISGDLCSGCAMCARVCPTGALAASREENVFNLAFDGTTCVSCYLCEDVCPRAAITRSEGTDIDVLAGTSPVDVFTKGDCEDPLAVTHDEKLGRLFSTFVNHA